MPINKEKSSAYLKYRRGISNITYSKITEITGVPGATLSAYFNGTVQSPNTETFSRLISAVGGSWEEYDAWQPEGVPAVDTNTKDVTDDVKVHQLIESLRLSYEDSITRMEKTHEKMLGAYARANNIQRTEKYILFFLLLAVSIYAVFAFTHYDLADPTSGLTSLFGK